MRGFHRLAGYSMDCQCAHVVSAKIGQGFDNNFQNTITAMSQTKAHESFNSALYFPVSLFSLQPDNQLLSSS